MQLHLGLKKSSCTVERLIIFIVRKCSMYNMRVYFSESRHLNPENSEDSSTIDLLILQMADEIENKARPESAPLIFESKDIRDHLIQAARHIRVTEN